MNKRSLLPSDLGALFFLAGLMLGSWFRISPPLNAGFPINDGGLFYVMIRSIQDHGYRLPEYVFYNGLNIPLAYPPLGFYISGLIADIFRLDLLHVLQWLPCIILITTLPAIFHLANLMLRSQLKAGLAVLLYSLLPRSINWLIMGGGVTRSFGQLFLILATTQIYLLFTNYQKKHLYLSILFSALVVLTHPEATIHTVGMGLTLWLLFGRNKTNSIQALLVAGGTLLITMPWWLIMLTRFGLTPYVSASQTGFYGIAYLFAFLMPFSQEKFIPLVAVFALLGVIYLIAKKEYALPILYAVPFFVEPRNAPNVSVIFMAILASIALCDLILPGLKNISSDPKNNIRSEVFDTLGERILFIFIVISLILGMQVFVMDLVEKRVSKDTLLAFQWIQSNTSKDSRFLVLTGETGPLEDFTNEWFPVLANRTSVTTLQGLEWNNNVGFSEHSFLLENIQKCRFNKDIFHCIKTHAGISDMEFDYYLILRTSNDPSIPYLDAPLVDKGSPYEIMYTSNDVFIVKNPHE